MWRAWLRAAASLCLLATGCCHPRITAVPLSPWNQCEEHGIPFYLPKPILIVAKNFRNIEDAKVGLTDGAPIPNQFDDQSKYADLNARTNFVTTESSTTSTPKTQAGDPATAPAGTATASGQHIFSDSGAPVTPHDVPPDGLSPTTFYTYQIVFIPDLTQKYGLKIKGGVGEIRAAMNLVNGWQFTGIGPFYMKDSSSAQNLLAGGIGANLALRGVADVVRSTAALQDALGRAGGRTQAGDANVQHLATTIHSLDLSHEPMCLEGFAEIHVYEPYLTPDGMMEWRPLTELEFDRQYLGTATPKSETTIGRTQSGDPTSAAGGAGSRVEASLLTDPDLHRTLIANALAIPPETLRARETGAGARTQAGAVDGTETGGEATQINVNQDCDPGCRPPVNREFNLFKFGCHEKRRRPQIINRSAVVPTAAIAADLPYKRVPSAADESPEGPVIPGQPGEQPGHEGVDIGEAPMPEGAELEKPQESEPLPAPTPN